MVDKSQLAADVDWDGTPFPEVVLITIEFKIQFDK